MKAKPKQSKPMVRIVAEIPFLKAGQDPRNLPPAKFAVVAEVPFVSEESK